MNFFDPSCQETPFDHSLFGICDNLKDKKAYTDTTDPNKWIAVVKNDSHKTLVFTAVDNCVIKNNEQKGRSYVCKT